MANENAYQVACIDGVLVHESGVIDEITCGELDVGASEVAACGEFVENECEVIPGGKGGIFGQVNADVGVSGGPLVWLDNGAGRSAIKVIQSAAKK